MRNDVKLGLAVGGLLLGVVLAYALFFSNTNKDHRELADGSYSALNNNSAADTSAQKPAQNTEQPTDSNPPTGAQPQPPANDHPQPPVADGSSGNPLIGKSWQLLLNEGATANSTGTITPPTDHGNTGAGVHTPTLPTRDNLTTNNNNTLVDPPPAPSGPRRYTVKHGDTYWVIAKAEYGNGAYYPHIQRANPGVDPARIKAGDSIILPDKSEVVAAPTATAKQPSAADLNIDQAKQYRVQAGDNLSTISKKLYGRYDKWVQIYELNKELIGQNPAALKKDMILALPEPPVRLAGTIQ